VRIAAERPCHWLADRNLTECAHNHEDRAATDAIGQHDRRSRHSDSGCRAEKQANANGCAERHYANVARLETGDVMVDLVSNDARAVEKLNFTTGCAVD
jgi:hypothetical protein